MRKFMRPRDVAGRPEPAAAPAGPAEGAGGAGGAGGTLWEDAEFPAAACSLADRRLARRAHWLRPHLDKVIELLTRTTFSVHKDFIKISTTNSKAKELCPRPRFLGDCAADGGPPELAERGAARWRLETGEAGDPALCCAAAALALTPSLLARVVPPQSFRAPHGGRFRFHFWVFGAWREVWVDDRLPARAARLLASRSALPDDFTLPLLEKAYAKLHGGYARLRCGSVARALQELTGGVVQSFSPPSQPRALLYQVLHSAVPRSTLLVASVEPARKEGAGRRVRGGLLAGQAYVVTGLARVRGAGGAPDGCDALVRLRAPAARGHWAGPWARDGPQWAALAEPDRELLESRAEDGHFWMSFADFARSFGRLELVHVGPDDWLREPALHGKRPWRAVLARRRWRRGHSAGGPPAAPTAHANPQFHVQVPRSEGGRCHVVVSVTQQYAVGARRGRLLGIGFAVYELPAGAAPRRAALAAALPHLRPLDVTHESRAREVVTFFTLPAGRYLVVPHAHRAHLEAAFLLRILTDEHVDVWEVNDDNAIVRDVAAELADEGRSWPPELRAAIARVVGDDDDEEVDAAALRGRLRRVWRRVLPARPSLELCRALVALRDPGVRGRLAARELPALLARLALWRAALAGAAGGAGCRRRVSAYELRTVLWACGVSASNKVLECLVLRFARGAAVDAEACVLALARLHLAHERYRSLDTKLKSNPLSLEEMILMTIYS